MSKKTKSNSSTPKTVIVLSFGVLVLVLLAIFTRGYIVSATEKSGFLSLQSEFKSFEYKFNSTDQGWQYDEFCRSEGGVYQGNIPSWCGVSLTNNNADLINSEPLIIEKYDSLIKNNSQFKSVGETKTTADGSIYKVYEYINLKGSQCTLGTNKERVSEIDVMQITFGCSHSAREFYFEKIN
jgi:hypothetical protein